jgi:phosphate uptake regulator
MLTFENIGENFRFLVLEVKNQVKATFELLEQPQKKLVQKIISRDDYIDNLKTIIENKCFTKIHSQSDLQQQESNMIRATHIMCVNLERIADFCVNIVRQMDYFSDPAFIHRFDYRSMFKEIEHTISLIIPTVNSKDVAKALSICKSEDALDRMYKECFDQILEELSTGLQAGNLVTAMFIVRYLERVGDSLLNIGEALIFAFLGEKIKIHQFQALQETLSKAGYDSSLANIDFQSIWGTRSGCQIRRVAQSQDSPEASKEVIFKEGQKEKIHTEKENLDRWSTLFPGIAPKVVDFHETSQSASMLVEFLPGCTQDEVVLTSRLEHLENSLFIITQTLETIWESTLKNTSVSSEFMDQTYSRLESISLVHPEFFTSGKKLHTVDIPTLDSQLQDCSEKEKQIESPFSVLIHGDFNLNNIVYDHEAQSIRFIDLYRSRDADYVQDISVFLISNFRIPVFEAHLRTRLNWSISNFLDFALQFAHKHKDNTFDARLTFGIARSFITSTRFELDQNFAKEMLLRGSYLLEKICEHKYSWDRFKFPKDILFY